MTTEALAAWYSEPGVDLYLGDCRAVMAQMPAGSVDCVVFSPPFFGLRKYDGIQELVWGARDGCEHEWEENPEIRRHKAGETNPGLNAYSKDRGGAPNALPGATCALCGAWRGAWGLEPSVELWVAHTLEVMQAVKRVLKPTGVAWIEVGDSYSGSGQGPTDSLSSGRDVIGVQRRAPVNGLKPKDLCLVPERLALALQADGWWVRSRIVWARPNPMPESVTDRPTKSHSTIWMLTKAASYFWDGEAVREKQEGPIKTRRFSSDGGAKARAMGNESIGNEGLGVLWTDTGSRQLRDVWAFPTSPFGYELCQACGQIYTAAQFGRLASMGGKPPMEKAEGMPDAFRNSRALIDHELDEEANPNLSGKVCRCGASDFLSHFATFSEAIPARCILASTSEAGCCPKCGRPWIRELGKVSYTKNRPSAGQDPRSRSQDRFAIANESSGWQGNNLLKNPVETLGWAPGCKCGLPQAENVPATVLDVCSGSGTTVLAAKKMGRRAVGIDLSEAYLSLARRRLSEVPMSLVKGG